jgi:hypothetical protein
MTYTGPNVKLGDYFVREIKRTGRQRRSVYLEIVGTGRKVRIGRREFERKARAA